MGSAIFIGKKRRSFGMQNFTIAHNKDMQGKAPAIFIAEPEKKKLHVKNTIVAHNLPRSVSQNSINKWNNRGGNIQFPKMEFGGGIIQKDPLLEEPKFNEGKSKTKTMALKAGSPAIDAGADPLRTPNRPTWQKEKRQSRRRGV